MSIKIYKKQATKVLPSLIDVRVQKVMRTRLMVMVDERILYRIMQRFAWVMQNQGCFIYEIRDRLFYNCSELACDPDKAQNVLPICMKSRL